MDSLITLYYKIKLKEMILKKSLPDEVVASSTTFFKILCGFFFSRSRFLIHVTTAADRVRFHLIEQLTAFPFFCFFCILLLFHFKNFYFLSGYQLLSVSVLQGELK